MNAVKERIIFMKYLFQFGIILGISFIGEALKYFIPLPVPASIYGLIIMLILLAAGILKVESVEDVSGFLIKIMPLMFIPAVAGLTESYKSILPEIVKIAAIVLITTVVVMAVCGLVTQLILRKAEEEEDE